MNILAFADIRNRLFRRDGKEFHRCAWEFKGVMEEAGHTVTLVETDEKKKWKKHQLVMRHLLTHPDPVDAVVFFCHGWHNGISLGFTRYHAGDLADAIAHAAGPDGSSDVILYACSTFKKKTSFGVTLCDELRDAGHVGTVVGHRTAGHATRNPHVWWSLTSGHKGEWEPWCNFIALPWLKRRKSDEWKRWVARLKTDDQYRFWC
jgi:hypothetical protein